MNIGEHRRDELLSRAGARHARGTCGVAATVAVALLLAATDAHAIPAFARKYGTACQTCHVIFPKLTPFGEAFRRNGFRFPGVDMDFIKQEQIPLGQEVNKKTFPRTTWPGILPSSVPLAFGVNGTAVLHPDKNSGAAQADNGTVFTMNDLVAEAHLWAGGSFSERTTFFGELTFGSDGSLDLELASVHFNDIGGLKHAINIAAGRFRSNITSFSTHSTYLADTLVPALAVTGLFGAKSDSWSLLNPFNGIEVNGTIAGRFIYAVGVNAGTNVDVRPSENVYGHVGVKIGGMRLDGEGSAAANPERPWEDTAITIDGFVYRSTSHFLNAGGNAAGAPDQDDPVLAFGGHIRAQWRSLELNAGAYQERHDRATDASLDGTSVNALSQYDELSYVIFPWLVPALRVEYARLDVGNNGDTFWNLKLIPGIAALILPNLKVVLSGQVELARGAPPGGWGALGGFAAPSDPTKFVGEIESIFLTAAYAY